MIRLTLSAFLICTPAAAKVLRVEITSRELVLGGREFGAVGSYERLAGRVYFALDPANPHNQAIVDLERAPRNQGGAVEFSADLIVLRPKSRARANGALIVDVPNRGGMLTGRNVILKDADVDAYYLRNGYTIAAVGWQFDVRPDKDLLHLQAPIVPGLEGRVRADFVVPARVQEHSVSHVIQDKVGGVGYPVADPRDATLTERDAPLAARRLIDPSKWRFSDAWTVRFDEGFVPGKIYEVVYTAKDPAVAGTGLAAVRDFAEYCRRDPSAVAPATRTYAMGISQTGRLLRHFVYEGFNASESGAQVFDGLLVYVAGAGRGSFNHRFAQPSRDSQPLSPLFYPNDLFPFTDAPTADPLSGKTEGLLDRARKEGVVPKIIYLNTAYEYWSRGGSLIHTTADGTKDVAVPEEVRIYFVPGIPHVAGPFPPGHRPVRDNVGQNLENPNSYTPFRRSMVAIMDRWVQGKPPPPSKYPRFADHTLVPLSALRPLPLAGVAYPRDVYQPYQMRFGSEPPEVVGTYPALVPQVGDDGNEIAGVHRPELEAALATYTGWNLRAPQIGFPEARTSFLGSYLPWPRKRVLDRFRSQDEYVGRYARAALALINERYLLQDDLAPLLDLAAQEWQFATRQ
jgi:Alpha/beta hydrolase domain